MGEDQITGRPQPSRWVLLSLLMHSSTPDITAHQLSPTTLLSSMYNNLDLGVVAVGCDTTGTIINPGNAMADGAADTGKAERVRLSHKGCV